MSLSSTERSRRRRAAMRAQSSPREENDAVLHDALGTIRVLVEAVVELARSLASACNGVQRNATADATGLASPGTTPPSPSPSRALSLPDSPQEIQSKASRSSELFARESAVAPLRNVACNGCNATAGERAADTQREELSTHAESPSSGATAEAAASISEQQTERAGEREPRAVEAGEAKPESAGEARAGARAREAMRPPPLLRKVLAEANGGLSVAEYERRRISSLDALARVAKEWEQ